MLSRLVSIIISSDSLLSVRWIEMLKCGIYGRINLDCYCGILVDCVSEQLFCNYNCRLSVSVSFMVISVIQCGIFMLKCLVCQYRKLLIKGININQGNNIVKYVFYIYFCLGYFICQFKFYQCLYKMQCVLNVCKDGFVGVSFVNYFYVFQYVLVVVCWWYLV